MTAAPASAESMALEIDRPADRWLWTRVELVAGWIRVAAESRFALRAFCGKREICVRPCRHPSGLVQPKRQGFWTLLLVQEHLDAIAGGTLVLDFFWGEAHVRTIHLRVTAIAAELAARYPLDLSLYPVPPKPAGVRDERPLGVGGERSPETLVFPGLGAVGGSSLSLLMRAKMLREGWRLPVYDEANAPELWRAVCAVTPPTAFRWIDGHRCHQAMRGCEGGRAPRIMLLRDPIVRMVSVFSYGTLVHPKDFPFETFDAFVMSGATWGYSQAVGVLRAAGLSVDPTTTASELYRLAHDEIRRSYALVGITELFEETIFLLCQLAGYDSIGMWWRVLSAPRAVDPEGLAPATRVHLERTLEADLRLYDEARTILRSEIARAACGEPLHHYKEAARRQAELPPSHKAVECLRWRQVLTDGALADAEWRLSLTSP